MVVNDETLRWNCDVWMGRMGRGVFLTWIYSLGNYGKVCLRLEGETTIDSLVTERSWTETDATVGISDRRQPRILQSKPKETVNFFSSGKCNYLSEKFPCQPESQQLSGGITCINYTSIQGLIRKFCLFFFFHLIMLSNILSFAPWRQRQTATPGNRWQALAVT